jgi:hypothetical protein
LMILRRKMTRMMSLSRRKNETNVIINSICFLNISFLFISRSLV